MGAMGGLLGLSGGASGTGFTSPEQANIQQGATVGQVTGAYDQTRQALDQQQNLLNALQGQGGLQNQSSVYNQLQGVANGQGPNPAQAMLAQQTGANVANQAALMAGQRGAGANVGLMARQAAMQGANTQQQAVGQGATLQANQSLNALNNMGNIANTQAANQIGATNAYTSAQQAQHANLLNALGGVNSNLVSSQGNVNSNNASLANTQMQGQQGMIGGLMNVIGGGAASGKAYGGTVGYADGGMLGVGTGMPTTQAPVFPGSGSLGSAPGGGFLGIGADSGSRPLNVSPVSVGDSLPQKMQQPLTSDLINLQSIPQAPQQGASSSFGQFISKVDQPAPAQQAPAQTAPSSGAGALFKGMSSLGGAGISGLTSMMGGGGDSGSGGGMMAMLPMLAAMSDKNSKKDIKSGDVGAQKFLDALKANEYRYKKSAGIDDKKHIGPMAQDLEKSTGGRAVTNTPNGKVVEYAKLGPEILASLANLNERVKSMEGGSEKLNGGGMVDVAVSPGEKLVPPGKVGKAAGGDVQAKTVPGKARVAGDNVQNDTVKMKLPAGTVVVPRTKSGNDRDAANFVRSVLAKRGKK